MNRTQVHWNTSESNVEVIFNVKITVFYNIVVYYNNNKKTTAFEDLCYSWLDGRMEKPANSRSSSSVIRILEYKSKTAPTPRCF